MRLVGPSVRFMLWSSCGHVCYQDLARVDALYDARDEPPGHSRLRVRRSRELLCETRRGFSAGQSTTRGLPAFDWITRCDPFLRRQIMTPQRALERRSVESFLVVEPGTQPARMSCVLVAATGQGRYRHGTIWIDHTSSAATLTPLTFRGSSAFRQGVQQMC